MPTDPDPNIVHQHKQNVPPLYSSKLMTDFLGKPSGQRGDLAINDFSYATLLSGCCILKVYHKDVNSPACISTLRRVTHVVFGFLILPTDE